MACLKIIDRVLDENDCFTGFIELGSLSRRFEVCVGHPWHEADYVAHWLAVITKLTNGAGSVCLVTSWTPTDHAVGFASGYAFKVYAIAPDDFRIQSCMLINEFWDVDFMSIHPSDLTPPPREVFAEDGERFLEWKASRADIHALRASLQKSIDESGL